MLLERKANVKHLDRQDMLSGRMAVEVPESCKMVIISNPDYLSGALLSAEAVGSLAGQCREKGALLFVDESLIELSNPVQSVASLVLSNDTVLITRSVSRTFALPGPEISFAIASPGLLGKLRMLLPAHPATPMSLSVASSMMRMKGGCNSSYLRESRKYIEKQRASLTDLFTRHGYKPERSDSTYILVRLKMVMGMRELTQRLASHGMMLLDCSSFDLPGEDYVRISVTARNNIDRLEETFGIVLKEWARDHARTSLERTLQKGELTGSNTQCPYYPCHFPGQDCTFCYCPFNPCEDERTGGEWICGSGGRKGWSCMDCCLIHESGVAQQVLDVLLEHDDLNEGLKAAWLNIISQYL
jgi:threonine-phosphate decarboxylase